MEILDSEECRFLVSLYDENVKINISNIDSARLQALFTEYYNAINDLIGRIDGPKIWNNWLPSNIIQIINYIIDIRKNAKIFYNYFSAENIYTVNSYDSPIIGKTLINSNKWLNIIPLDLKHKCLDSDYIQHINLHFFNQIVKRKLDDILTSIQFFIHLTRVSSMITWFLLNMPGLYYLITNSDSISITWLIQNIPWRITIPILLWWLIPIIIKKIISYPLEKKYNSI